MGQPAESYSVTAFEGLPQPGLSSIRDKNVIPLGRSILDLIKDEEAIEDASPTILAMMGDALGLDERQRQRFERFASLADEVQGSEDKEAGERLREYILDKFGGLDARALSFTEREQAIWRRMTGLYFQGSRPVIREPQPFRQITQGMTWNTRLRPRAQKDLYMGMAKLLAASGYVNVVVPSHSPNLAEEGTAEEPLVSPATQSHTLDAAKILVTGQERNVESEPSPSLNTKKEGRTRIPKRSYTQAEKVFAFLGPEEVKKVPYLNDEQRQRVLALTQPILRRRVKNPEVVARHISRLDMFLRGKPVAEIAEITGQVIVNSIYENARRLNRYLSGYAQSFQTVLDEVVVPPQAPAKLNASNIGNGKTPSVTRQPNIILGSQLDAITKQIKEEGQDFDPNEVIAQVDFLLRGSDVNYRDVNTLAYHFLGMKVDVNSTDFQYAARAMRRVIDGAVSQLRRYHPDKRGGLMTREDAWLFAKLIGNPDEGVIALSPNEIIEYKYEQNPDLYRPTTSQLIATTANALKRLRVTLAVK